MMDQSQERIAWVDYAKGFCIVFVVMMHSTLGVEAAAGQEGFMHYVVAFARPFRMPDFFMISGLFLSLVIARDWRTYLDRKVVHFAYFYVLWLTIQFVIKNPTIVHDAGIAGALRAYLFGFIEPPGALWFIAMLPIFFVVTRVLRPVHPVIVWLAAAALEISHLTTGWTMIDEFAARFVYFYTGYVLAPHIFALAERALAQPRKAVVVLALWAIVNGFFVFNGWADLPFLSLALGLIGVAAVIRFSALLSLTRVARPLRYCGQHSIVIYLAFFLPMAATRVLLLKTGLITDLGWVSIIVTAVGVIAPLLLYWLVRGTFMRFLFARPDSFWLTPARRPAMQPAE
jgi:uncharacterized membrane protein YcfT